MSARVTFRWIFLLVVFAVSAAIVPTTAMGGASPTEGGGFGPVDADGEGLPDEQELALGTDPNGVH